MTLPTRFRTASAGWLMIRLDLQRTVQRADGVAVASQFHQGFAPIMPEPHVAVVMLERLLIAVQRFRPALQGSERQSLAVPRPGIVRIEMNRLIVSTQRLGVPIHAPQDLALARPGNCFSRDRFDG